MSKDYIGFTLDLRVFASVMSQDPTCRAELLAGINGVDEPITSQLGAANFGTNEAPRWASVFPATVQGKEPNQEGLFYRNSSHDGKGDRVQMRLKEQTKQYSQKAPAQEQYQITPTHAMPQGAGQATAAAAALALKEANPELFAKLLATVKAEQGNAQLNAAPEVKAAVEPPLQHESSTPEIPADIAAILNAG